MAFGACLIRFAGEYACSEGGWYLGYIILNIGTFALLFVTSVAIVYYALQGLCCANLKARTGCVDC